MRSQVTRKCTLSTHLIHVIKINDVIPGQLITQCISVVYCYLYLEGDSMLDWRPEIGVIAGLLLSLRRTIREEWK